MPKRNAEHMRAQRERIARAVLECIAEKGVERTSITDICRKAGLSTGALYVHYRNKDELVSAALLFGMLEDALPDSWPALVDTLSSLEDLRGFDMATIARARLHLYADSVMPGPLHQLYRPIIERGLDRLSDWLETMEKQGQIRLKMTPAQTARAIGAIFDGLQWIALGIGRPLEDVRADLRATLACLIDE